MKSIFCVGDSITQMGFAVSDRGWLAQFADYFQRRLHVVNGGFSGYNTNDLLCYLPAFLCDLSPEKCLVATLFMGANDAALDNPSSELYRAYASSLNIVPSTSLRFQHVSLAQYTANIRELIVTIWQHCPHAHLVVITPTQVDESMLAQFPNLAPRINTVNRLYADAVCNVTRELNESSIELLNGTRKLVTLDLWAAMERRKIRTGALPVFVDGIHLNSHGNDLLFDELLTVFKEQLNITQDTQLMNAPYWRDIVEPQPND